MKTICIAEGIELTEIALGTGKRGDKQYQDETFRIMDRYVEMGGNCFDSARVYEKGNSDIELGQWLRSRGIRHKLVLVTKGSHPIPETMHIPRLSRSEIEADVDASLKAFGTDYTDLHLLHRDDVRVPVSEIMPSLDSLVKAGKARAIGVSNWTVTRIIEANAFAAANGLTPLSCSQVHFSLAQTTAAATGDITHVPMNDIEFSWYRESQFPIMAYCTQARGWFVMRARKEEPKKSPLRYYDLLPENHRRLERLKKLSAELGKSIAAITNNYVRDNVANAVALCGFSSVRQLEESFESLTFRLTPEQIRYLETGE